MQDTIGSYLWKEKDSGNRTLQEVQNYWNSNVNTTQFWTGDPTAIGSPEFFDTVARYIKKNYGHRYRLINSESKKYPGGKILEVGCGAGWELVEWARQGMQVHGVDLSPGAIDLAKRNFEYNRLSGNIQLGNAESLPFPDNTFDIVSSMGVLHQTTSTQKAVSEVYRVLKPGGEAIVLLYYKYSWKILLSKLGKVNFEFAEEDAPITRLYDKKELRALFKAFDDVDVYLDYIYATKSPRRGFLPGIFNTVFVPIYNLLPYVLISKFGHSAITIAKKKKDAFIWDPSKRN